MGLGLLIWGLDERKRRYVAERWAREAREKEKDAEARERLAAKAAESAVKRLQLQVDRLTEQLNFVRRRLLAARKVVLEHAPIGAVRKWIDGEGKGGKV
ncbi:MAG: hypothetical protein KJN79_09350 [Gammaproteobacteria bacterium]|nr:hypothetical protein [Gammaproteobacteria bacterium]